MRRVVVLASYLAVITALSGCSGPADTGDSGPDPADAATPDASADAGRDAAIPGDAAIPDDAGDPDGGVQDGGDVDAGCSTATDCDDGDACTSEACETGACQSTPVDTDDDDVCTTDACDPETGVSHTPIAGCCRDDDECTGGTCVDNACRPFSCTDGAQNGQETAIDCGGTECAPCELGLGCALGSDCASGACVGSVCVECESALTCPGTDTECQTRTCTDNACGLSFTAAGTPTSAQTAGDCQRSQCDGAGAVVSAADDSDVPADDGNQCTGAACASGAPAHPPLAAGTTCSQGGGARCDGTGVCVQCVSASDCPGADTECQARTCNAGVCGFAFTAAGTPVSVQTAGDCQQSACDGSGSVVSVADNADLPVDGNQCTNDVCTSGVPSNPPLAAGTACSQSGGVECDGAGACVGSPTVTGTSPADATSSVAGATIAVTFSTAMNPATLSAQTSAGACAGAVQVSLDGFASCIALGAAAPVMSAGDTVATFTAAPGLLVNRTYRVRVTTAATSAAGISMGAQYTSASGFETTSPDLCAGSVVIAQVYGAGGNSGALYTHDFVVLHNRGTTAVSLAGWSLQYAAATGTSWSTAALNGSIAAGGHYLVQLVSGGAVGSALPTPDAMGSLNLAAANGKVALVSSTTALTGSCPTGGAVVDFVGFGTANCSEGGAAAPAPSNTTAAIRVQSGCVDLGNNAADFAVGAPAPLNSASPTSACGCFVQNESGAALEADYCNVQFPLSLEVATGASTGLVYGRLYEAGVTDAAGPSPNVLAQLGFGPASANPQYQAGWSWTNATYNVQSGDSDEYQASFTAPAAGSYRYAYRFSLDRGVSWTLCDENAGDFGAGSNAGLSFELASLPQLTVTP